MVPALPRPVRALAAFHLRAGGRAALRSSAIGVSVVVFALGSAPDAAYTFRSIVLDVVGPDRGGAPEERFFLAAGTLALAAAAARRVTLGAGGWMRSLPASGDDARRAAWAACAAATLPAALFILAGAALALTAYRSTLSAPRMLGAAMMLLAAAALPLPVERTSARRAALGALGAAAFGTWPALLAAVALLALWDRAAGGLAPVPLVRARASAPARERRLPARFAAHATLLRFAWRATGWRALADALALAAIPIGFCALIRANNADLAPGTPGMLARLGAALGAALAAASFAGPLLARRPPWPWLRTLPWSSRERVLADAMVVFLPAAAAALLGAAAFALVGPAGAAGIAWTSGVGLASALVAAASAAAALRIGAGRQTGAVGEAALVGVVAAVALALVSWAALAAPPAAAALLALGARRERRSADAVRWSELRHGAVGDAGWIARS